MSPSFNFQFHYMTLGSPDLVIKMLLSDLGLVTDGSLLLYREQPVLDPSVDQNQFFVYLLLCTLPIFHLLVLAQQGNALFWGNIQVPTSPVAPLWTSNPEEGLQQQVLCPGVPETRTSLQLQKERLH